MEDHGLYIDVGSKIRARRVSLGMTLNGLAAQLNKSVSTVAKYETGAIQISLDDLIRISRVLKIDFYSLIPSSYLNSENYDATRYKKFHTDKVYVYWYNGAQNVVRTAVVENNNATFKSLMYCDTTDEREYYRCKYIYHGDVFYSDTSITWLLHNDAPPFDILTLRSPTLKDTGICRIGLMTTISYFYQHVAIKAAISNHPLSGDSSLPELLRISKGDIKSLRESNMFGMW